MELKHRLSLVVAIMSVALGSGHLVQNVLIAPPVTKLLKAGLVPVDITLVAAGPDVLVPYLPPAANKMPSFAELPDPDAPSLFSFPDDPVLKADLGASPATPGENECMIDVDLLAEPMAMVGLTMLAPCHPDERVVLRHEGLVVTAKTSGTGALFVSLPALSDKASLSVRFRDGATVTRTVAVPDAGLLRRFGVQWIGDEAFQLHAFENGSDYGDPGHVSAANPHFPTAGQPVTGGFLSLLGDDQVDMPMLAEVYTYPIADDTPVRIVLEAAVTKGTCARDILGETLADVGGDVTVTELTLAMPDCNAIGDILVLKNLDPALKIAAN